MPLILDGTKGETFPSWTTATRPATPNAGQTGYNTTLGILETYNGSVWLKNINTITPGTVLQAVNATYGTAVTNNTSTMTSTGLTASITPSSATNKILVIASISGIYKQTNNTGATLALYRGAGNIFQFEYTGGANNSTNVNCYTSATTYLDAPATTSSTTYTFYFASQANSAGITVQLNGGASTITLLEIAA